MSDEEFYDLILWDQQLRETNNEAFLPLFECESRFLVLKGGGGSGKSIFAGRKILERAVTERGHRFLVCRKVGRTLRESCFVQLRMQLSKYYSCIPYKVNMSDMKISFSHNGSEILFSGLDDVEKLKSIYNITGIWIEEASELLESDFNQLDIRLRGETEHYKQIILSFNPISITHWLKARFFDRCPDNVTVHESTYRDNRFLDDEAKKVLEDFKNSDEYYYDVYCLGHWGVTGKTVFDARKVQQRLSEISAPIRRGRYRFDYDGLKISNVRFEEREDGECLVYRDPEAGHPYIIGCDTAGEGSDSCVMQMIDASDGVQVMSMASSDMDEDVFAHQIYAAGIAYMTALIAVESNFSTYPIRELERLNYPKQYVRETFDNLKHEVRLSFGFRTDTKTRPVIISNLVQLVRENVETINDRRTLEEMLTFVRNEDTYKPEAEEGAHDDAVMALAIAHFVRGSGQQKVTVNKSECFTDWSESMFEDFRRAKKEDRQKMIERWGRPKQWRTS